GLTALRGGGRLAGGPGDARSRRGPRIVPGLRPHRPPEPGSARLGHVLPRRPPERARPCRAGRGLAAATPLGVVGSRRGFREVPDALLRRPLRKGILHRRQQLLEELLRHVHAGDDDTGDVALLDLVIDPRERDRELVRGESDVGEVRVDARHLLRVEVDVELALLRLLVHRPTILRAWSTSSRSAASATPWSRCCSSSSGARSAITPRSTRPGCSPSTGPSSPSRSPGSTARRRTTRRGSSRSFSSSPGSL